MLYEPDRPVEGKRVLIRSVRMVMNMLEEVCGTAPVAAPELKGVRVAARPVLLRRPALQGGCGSDYVASFVAVFGG